LTDLVSHTFRKEEKLCSQKLMGDLFLTGNSFLSYPLRVVWKLCDQLPSNSPAQSGFSVPKKNFRHAVDRNTLKRRIRESFRLHKTVLYDQLAQSDHRLVLMFVYIAKEELPYVKIEPSVVKAIKKIMGQLTDSSPENE
jgi:ribonuclease P protein component